jgi:hypothetical protein
MKIDQMSQPIPHVTIASRPSRRYAPNLAPLPTGTRAVPVVRIGGAKDSELENGSLMNSPLNTRIFTITHAESPAIQGLFRDRDGLPHQPLS